jgi:hypothetical protein
MNDQDLPKLISVHKPKKNQGAIYPDTVLEFEDFKILITGVVTEFKILPK